MSRQQQQERTSGSSPRQPPLPADGVHEHFAEAWSAAHPGFTLHVGVRSTSPRMYGPNTLSAPGVPSLQLPDRRTLVEIGVDASARLRGE